MKFFKRPVFKIEFKLMENKEIFDEFFEYASKNYLEKLFRIDNKSIFLKE